jgi:subtilisin family serine protease
LRIAPVRNYEPALSETVPYIGASSLHTQGVTGSGITVAVLDTGVDYTHANLGGPGTPEAYEAAYGTALPIPKIPLLTVIPHCQIGWRHRLYWRKLARWAAGS